MNQIKIACLGDLLIDDSIMDYCRTSGLESAKNLIFKPVNHADLILANFEAPVTDSDIPRENKVYNLKASKDSLRLFDRRFVLNLANNHIMDYGQKGLFQTIEKFKENQLLFAGAGKNLAEARKPVVHEFKGKKIGILCAADAVYQPATETCPGTFPADPDLLKESIQHLNSIADIIIVSIHSGNEYICAPSNFQLNIAQTCLKEGVFLVHFHHSHCLSGIEKTKHSIVLYGTGNYIYPKKNLFGYQTLIDNAAWMIKVDTATKKIDTATPLPFTLKNPGIPDVLDETQGQNLIRKIKRLSFLIKQKKLIKERVRDMLHYKYIWISIKNYSIILKNQGAGRLLDVVFNGLRSMTGK